MKYALVLAFAGVLFAQNNRNAPGALNGYVSDSSYQTLQAACGAAGPAMTVLNAKKWLSVPTQTLSCHIFALAGGVIQPAANATVKISGSFSADLAQHFDLSLGGHVDLTGATIVALYPQWFGAKCGEADDTAAIQQTLNVASANRTVIFPCLSTISSTVYNPSSNAGSTLEGTAFIDIGSGHVTSGLIAKTGAPPFVMLKDYAPNSNINNLYIDCNHVGTRGVIFTGTMYGNVTNLGVQHCSGDGVVISPVGGPATTITSEIRKGDALGSMVTVTKAELPGKTLGDSNCRVLMLEYGSAHQEIIEYVGAGNTLKWLALKAQFDHPAGSSIQCSGNNDMMTFHTLQSQGNGGWGFNIEPGSDNNAISSYNPTAFVNKAGGELWTGFAGLHVGGHSEGNNGPAMQLGDENGGGANGANGRMTGYITVDPFQDLENSKPEFNVVKSVCGFGGTIRFKQPDTFVSVTGGCPAYAHFHTTDIGFGPGTDSITDGLFAVKTALGSITLQPGTNAYDGIRFYDAAGHLINTLNTKDGHSDGFAAGSGNTSYITSQFAVQGIDPKTRSNLMMGYRTDLMRGFLQSENQPEGHAPLDLNPLGGTVTLGHGVGGITKTFANNAAAIAGGLVAGDIYAIAGTDPRQLAIVF